MKEMKQSWNNRCWTTDIYDDMWTLGFIPKYEGNSFFIGVHICSLPYNISKVRAKFTFKIYEANINKSEIGLFAVLSQTKSALDTTMSFEEFKEFNYLTLEMEITILDKYDLYGNDISMTDTEDVWNKYIKTLNESKQIKMKASNT